MGAKRAGSREQGATTRIYPVPELVAGKKK